MENFHWRSCPCIAIVTFVQFDVLHSNCNHARKTGRNSEDGLQVHGDKRNNPSTLHFVVFDTLPCHE